MEKALKDLLQVQKKEERKAQNDRLCERGKMVEKLLPGLAELDGEQFELFVEMVLNTDQTKKVIAELLPPKPAVADGNADSAQESKNDAAPPAPSAERTGTAPSPKPAGTAQTPSAGNGGKRCFRDTSCRRYMFHGEEV